MSHSKNTSLISILSTEHGRIRREQRDIDKRDLQKALKYGKAERCWGMRWKVEHDGVIFITDNNIRREVTAFPSPLSMAPLDAHMELDHLKAKQVLDAKPELCASHSVLVVDNSGSMSTHDINLHRDRQTAAYSITALEFIAEQLLTESANNSDVVSLIEFSGEAKLVFEREPISWVLYNKLLSRRDSRVFSAREHSKLLDIYHADSNYMPALDMAQEVLARGTHEDCALSLLFLSDGAPTDAHKLGLMPKAAQEKLDEKMRDIAHMFDFRLNVKLVGFGDRYNEFKALSKMAEAANSAPGDAVAEFVYCDKIAHTMGTAVTSLVTSLTATRTSLMGNKSERGKTKRAILSENQSQKFDEWEYHKILNHFLYDPRANELLEYDLHPPGAVSDLEKCNEFPRFLALNKFTFGEGAERLAFRCRLTKTHHESGFMYQWMVAKETNVVERIQDQVQFHCCFCEQQHLAAHLADEFNKRVRSLPIYLESKTPQVSFLKCSVLVLEDLSWPNGSRGVLVEKMLDTSRFQWMKWNDNAGGLDGGIRHLPIDVDYELANLCQSKDKEIQTVLEEDSEEESDSGDDQMEQSNFSESVKPSIYLQAFSQVESKGRDDQMEQSYHSEPVKPSDYLQAFSHFTHLFTCRKVLVCDLQGVYNTDMVPPCYELTDPAIHYHSKQGRQMVFGRTDMGRKGMELFFKTHKCTIICRFMKLSRKNKAWKNAWRTSSS